MKLSKLFLCCLSVFVLASCFDEIDHDIVFVQKIKEKIESGEKYFSLHDVTDFSWDQVCVFYPADSYPYSAYSAYEKFLKREGENVSLLKKKKYSLIFLFKDKSTYRQFGTTRQPIRVDGKKHWLRIRGESSTRLGGCLNGDANIQQGNNKIIELL